MASIQKTAHGYRVQIKLRGVRESRLFPTKREAAEWASIRESEIRHQATQLPGERYTLLEAMRRYAEEVSPTHRGERWERVRLTAFERYLLPIDTPVARVTAADIALFRDSRLRGTAPASVNREMSLLSAVFEVARREWGWVKANPCREVRKPAKPAHRDRIISPREIRAMLVATGYRPGHAVRSVSQAVGAVMMLALRTGMRAGELCGLPWARVRDRHADLPMTKNGTARQVPLSSRALRVLADLRGWDDVMVAGIKTATLDALFRKYRERAGLSGFRFHDTRHTAATMMSRRVDVLTLCKIFGWRDPRYAMVYVNPSASDIAKILS